MLDLFLRDDDHAHVGAHLREVLRRSLPVHLQDHATGHEVHTLRGYLWDQLAVDLDRDLDAVDWLTLSEQRLLMLTAGAVFHDDVGLEAVRKRFGYYPRDVWRYLMVAGWWRVHPEINVVGRAGHVGDELGSALIGSRLVHDLMRLCFLIEQRYAPYAKWFGTAFGRLDCGPGLTPVLSRVVRAATWREREQALAAAYAAVAALHEATGITEPVPVREERMWDRPFGGPDQARDLLWDVKRRGLLCPLIAGTA